MSQPKILIVDDDPQALEIFSTFLRHYGLVVHEARDGEEGRRLTRELMPALVLMDVSMPGVDGVELVRQLKADGRTRDIPLVAVTAHALEGDRERFERAGFDAYLPKPVDPATVLTTVKRLLQEMSG